MKKTALNILVAFAIVSVALVSCKKTQVSTTTEESSDTIKVDSLVTESAEEVVIAE